jgi:hypothetical protein
MWLEIQTHNLLLYLKQLNYSRVRTKQTYFSLVNWIFTRERSSKGLLFTLLLFFLLLLLFLFLLLLLG